MKFSDIVVLAKQGYKPADIKELMSLSTPDQGEDQTEPDKDTAHDEPDEQTPEVKQDTELESTQDEPEEPDYKKLYEETEKKLKAAQAANRAGEQKIEKEKTPEEIAVEHFMKLI